MKRQGLEEMLTFRLPSGKAVTGTLVWYYAICKREVWLMAHNITPDEEHYALDFGRATHESFYKTMKKEVGAEGVKIDVLRGKDRVICEVKTSSKYVEAAKLQLTYYLYRLEEMGAKVTGEILIPLERRRVRMVLNEKMRSKLKQALDEIVAICLQPTPPPPVKIRFCRKCAYFDFCWEQP